MYVFTTDAPPAPSGFGPQMVESTDVKPKRVEGQGHSAFSIIVIFYYYYFKKLSLLLER